ncbi:hypothetical protein H261_00370 [Paramagnetospirillum caucaseum]|uniref:Uncharacterized protein n=1 Tax=Paramagnetospirillum caucaseum TaxID=1244869 RepID=M2ZX49_9PROT|nr:hypothetical protein [Paramagnetospirillum caucaseum]EME71987.1 hypothetical protein H261_00370 [Paramagnetospirillum caucaseum]
MEDPAPPKRPTTRSGRPTRSDPPEDCPVKDRCRRARAQVCLDCGVEQKLRRGRRKAAPPPCPVESQ